MKDSAMKHEQQPASPGGGKFQDTKEVESDTRGRMEKVLVDLQHELTTVRTGRASLNLLDSVRVEAYGSMVPLNEIAQLHVPEPAMITVQPWDSSTLSAVEKGIRNANLGLNPGNDGKIVRVPIPPLTEERRRDLAKRVSHIAEERRVGLRNLRREANEALKKMSKDKLISGDEERLPLDVIQKLTDNNISRIDQAAKAKEKELLEFK
jgi:ribosome recycling factor